MLINLHSHLEGRIRPTTAAELAIDLGLPVIDWAQALQLTAPADLPTYLTKVAASYPFFATPDTVRRLAYEAVEDAAADGVDYLELRFGPATHANARQDIASVVAAVCDGARDAEQRHGIVVGLIVAALRTHDQDTNLQVAAAAVRYAGDGVVGFDLAGDELRYPDVQPFAECFAIARSAGLGLTCHAAEAAPAAAAQQAVELLGARRIGHGTHIAHDPAVMRWAAAEGIVLEVCPTSNLFTGAINRLEDHPVAVFAEAGIPVVIGDDNPRQTGSEFSAEHRLLATTYGLSSRQLSTLQDVSIDAAFCQGSSRQKLLAKTAAGRAR